MNYNIEELKKKKIREIVENVDFKRIHKTMLATKWKWVTNKTEFAVPSIGTIVLRLIRMLDDAIDAYNNQAIPGTTYTVASAGFYISVYENEMIDNEMIDPFYVTVKFCVIEEEA